MRPSIPILLASLVPAALLAACDGGAERPGAEAAVPVDAAAPSPSTRPPVDAARTPPPVTDRGIASYARASNAFGFELHRSLAKAGGNVVSSPTSVENALTMVWGGAEGATAAELQAALHLDGSRETMLASMGELAARLQRAERPALASVNRLFVDQSIRLQPAYVAFAREAFAAPPERVDFLGAPVAARERINRWVEDRTRGQIPDLLPGGAVSSATRLVVANAMYFEARWSRPFEDGGTVPAAFWADGSREVATPTMSKRGSMRFAEVDGARIVELDYEGGTTSMVIVVPDERDGLAALEASLDLARYERWTAALASREVRLSLPRFAMAAPPLPLREHLAGLGVRTAFDPERADFSGLGDARDAPFFLGDVFHRATIRVDEKGTVATAASVAVLNAVSIRPEPRVVRVEHPFLFLIRHVTTGAVLFVGRVTDPTAPAAAPPRDPGGLVRVRYLPPGEDEPVMWREDFWAHLPWPWGPTWSVDPSRVTLPPR